MPMSESICINAIEKELQEAGFDLNKAPHTKKFVSIIVNKVLAEVKKGTITVFPLGLIAPPSGGPVTGQAKGTIS